MAGLFLPTAVVQKASSWCLKTRQLWVDEAQQLGKAVHSRSSYRSSFGPPEQINIRQANILCSIFQPEEYVTSSVLGQGVFDSLSLTLVIGARNFKQILNTFKVIRYILRDLESYF
jgi:hypothetical protein